VTYRYATTFDRTFRHLPPDRQRRVTHGIVGLIDRLEARQLPSGMGLKRLRGALWEFRVGLHDRVLIKFEGSVVTFALVGSHDDIHRYLKHG